MDAFNRGFLLVLGLALIVSGLAMLGTASGLMDAVGLDPLRPPGELLAQSRAAVSTWAWPLWTALLIGLVLLALLAFWLATRQLAPRRPRAPREVTLAHGERGETTVAPQRVAAMGERDLRAASSVLDDRMRFIEMGQLPLVDVDVQIAHRTPVEALLNDAEPVFRRLATTVGADDVRAVVRVRHADPLPKEAPSRVG